MCDDDDKGTEVLLSGLESDKAGEVEPVERGGEGGNCGESKEAFFTPNTNSFGILMEVILLLLLVDSVQAVKRISGVEAES